MINLLPPAAKEQYRYAKYNRRALAYLRLIIVVVVVLAGIFVATIYYMDHLIATKQTDLDAMTQQIASYAPDKKLATDAAGRLNAIKTIEASQTRFSQLLYDLAAVLPKGITINGISLTGDATKPVILNVSGTTYDEVLAFRDAIVTSPRISGADLVNITGSVAAGYQANVVLGFNPGQAK